MTDDKRLELSLLLKEKGSIIFDFLNEKREVAIRKLLNSDNVDEASAIFYQSKVYDLIIMELLTIKNYEVNKGE